MKSIARIGAAVGVAALAATMLAAPAQASDGNLAGALAGENRGPNSVSTTIGNVDPAPWAFSKGGSPSNWYDFDILVNAVVFNGGEILAQAVEDPDASLGKAGLTLFAPNDRAFQLLAYDLSGRKSWPATEKQVVDVIVGAVGGGLDLNNVLGYHVTSPRLDGSQVKGALDMLNGGVVEASRSFGSIKLDASGPLADPRVVRTVDAGDDIVHVISRVLVP
ncbi:MAG TPA: fasciclin domain-containing protein [Dermatophilaceae bacterium]|nr:fasciclin domain-containing protein [Dermatophilaceae bacterium]